jgi:adenosylhomocysteine nucleosidase
MIGITFALPAESSYLRRRVSEVRREGDLFVGKIDNRDVAILHTGVGAKNCNERIETLLHKARPRLVISSGFAGAVIDDVEIGDLILAENFSHRELLARARQILRDRNPRVAKLFTSTSIVDSIAQRNEVARASGADAVDMETGAIVEVCRAHGVSMLSLRAITDSPSEPFPAPPSVLFDIESQRTRFSRLLAYILRDPGSGWRLVRFGKRVARVRASLTDAVVALVKAI